AGCSNQRIEQALTGSMNKIATLFHPKIYGGTMLLTLNSSKYYKDVFDIHLIHFSLDHMKYVQLEKIMEDWAGNLEVGYPLLADDLEYVLRVADE
ncbi:hypothetical protein, partial [Thiolapillus sp.]|uniref:hypothetical protein n=1 Tax=Thiolapillus sp. TaxID=2017437 RepID=UPI003AF8D134